MKRSKVLPRSLDEIELVRLASRKIMDAADRAEISAQAEEAAVLYEYAQRMYAECVTDLEECRVRMEQVSRLFAKLGGLQHGTNSNHPRLDVDAGHM